MNESGWRKKQIADLQACADIMAGDGGYRIGNAEDHAAFVAERNKSLMKNFLVERVVDGQKIYCLRKAITKEDVEKMFDVPVRIIEL
jgi:hypothetical protein